MVLAGGLHTAGAEYVSGASAKKMAVSVMVAEEEGYWACRSRIHLQDSGERLSGMAESRRQG